MKTSFYDQVCNFFIRPSRQHYNLHDLNNPTIRSLGRRRDFEVISNRGYKLKCSFFECFKATSGHVVLYCHSFNGSRLQSIRYVQNLLQKNLYVCIFDFAGSGCSEGQFVSLGYHEKNDILSVVIYLVIYFNITVLTLWGRSMGAVSAIKFCRLLNQIKYTNPIVKNLRIQSLILDSPFCSLNRLTIQIVQKQISIPQILIRAVFLLIKSTIEQKAQFKVQQLQMLNDLPYIICPVLVLASKNDQLINYRHSQEIYNNINFRSKQLIFIDQEHNQYRTNNHLEQIYNFIKQNRQYNNYNNPITEINKVFCHGIRSNSLKKYQPHDCINNNINNNNNHNNNYINNHNKNCDNKYYINNNNCSLISSTDLDSNNNKNHHINSKKAQKQQKNNNIYGLCQQFQNEKKYPYHNSLHKTFKITQYGLSVKKNPRKTLNNLLNQPNKLENQDSRNIKTEKNIGEQRWNIQKFANTNFKLIEEGSNHLNVISSKLKKKIPKVNGIHKNQKNKFDKASSIIHERSLSQIGRLSTVKTEQDQDFFQQKAQLQILKGQKQTKKLIKKNMNQLSHSNKCLIVLSPRKIQQ